MNKNLSFYLIFIVNLDFNTHKWFKLWFYENVYQTAIVFSRMTSYMRNLL